MEEKSTSFILHVKNMRILRLANSINSFTVVSSLSLSLFFFFFLFALFGNNSTETKVMTIRVVSNQARGFYNVPRVSIVMPCDVRFVWLAQLASISND